MRAAFYAPLKAPDHPLPSGDRRIARLLMAALVHAGYDVRLVSRFRSYDGHGDAERQARLARLGQATADRLIARWQALPAGGWRPDLWFTYHLYHKAPDWLGPRVAAALRIPYLVAEASFAPKRADGPWRQGHAAVGHALHAAHRVFGLNPEDAACVVPQLRHPGCWIDLPPFLDGTAFRAEASRPSDTRLGTELAAHDKPGGAVPRLLTVAMMRDGAKLRSYQILGKSLQRLGDRPFHLDVVGDGPARNQVHEALAPIADRVTFLGALEEESLPALYRRADLFVWPAVDEAIGMAMLEAQAAGLPVIAGCSGAIPSFVQHGRTGLLVPAGDATVLATAIASLLDDSNRRAQQGHAAQAAISEHHNLAQAAENIGRALDNLALCEPWLVTG